MLGYLLFLIYLVLGVMMAAYLLPEKRLLVRLWAGFVLGIVALMWSNIPFSFLLGFGKASHLCGLGLTVLLTFGLYFYRAKRDKKPLFEKHGMLTRVFGDFAGGFTHDDRRLLLLILPFMLFAAICLGNHSFYNVDGSLYTGQCTYGDMNFHLGIITSMKEQGTFPPEYSICPGNQLDYYFLCDSVSSSLYLFGMGLRAAYVLPMLFGFLLVFLGFWLLAEAVLGKFSKATIAFVLFFLNGGFGTFYFLDNLRKDPKNFTQIFTEYYHTPTNYVNSQGGTSNICWTNTVVDMMLPQRATLFGWMLLFLVLYLLYNSVFESEKAPWNRHFIAAGVLAGLAPMVQTYTYFTIGLAAAAWLVYSVIRDKFSKKVLLSWVMFGVPALALSIPQLKIWIFGAVGGKSFISIAFNAYNESDNWLWFWVKNVGLVFILLLPAFLSVPKKLKLMYSAGLLIFVVTEFVKFQTFAYDNNKLYLMWYAFSTLIVADFLVECYRKLEGVRGRAVIAVILLVIATNAAVLTMGREMYSGFRPQSYSLYDAKAVRAAEFIEENTPSDALFICHNNHNNVIACLTGRNIFVGSGTFLYSHDVGYQERQNALYSIFNDQDDFEKYREEYGFDYAYISEWERANLDKGSFISDYLRDTYTLVYDQDNIQIYDLNAPLAATP
ncbi:MAG: hypothetical protein J6V14_08660 [Clostridia bacterium]|nr:hypothetical protein [Clostridia bacterium]